MAASMILFRTRIQIFYHRNKFINVRQELNLLTADALTYTNMCMPMALSDVIPNNQNWKL